MHMIRTVPPLSHFEPEKNLHVVIHVLCTWVYIYIYIYIYTHVYRPINLYVFCVAGTHFDLKIFLYNLSL